MFIYKYNKHLLLLYICLIAIITYTGCPILSLTINARSKIFGRLKSFRLDCNFDFLSPLQRGENKERAEMKLSYEIEKSDNRKRDKRFNSICVF